MTLTVLLIQRQGKECARCWVCQGSHLVSLTMLGQLALCDDAALCSICKAKAATYVHLAVVMLSCSSSVHADYCMSSNACQHYSCLPVSAPKLVCQQVSRSGQIMLARKNHYDFCAGPLQDPDVLNLLPILPNHFKQELLNHLHSLRQGATELLL